MGWIGVGQAVRTRDPEWLAEELGPKANPNTPTEALALAVQGFTDDELCSARAWAARFLRDNTEPDGTRVAASQDVGQRRAVRLLQGQIASEVSSRAKIREEDGA